MTRLPRSSTKSEARTCGGSEYHKGLLYTYGMPTRQSATARESDVAAALPSLRSRTRDAMRAEVSEVAFRMFAEQGFHATTVDQIATTAGLSRTTFFRYFGTKEELVLEKVNEVGRDVALALAARPAEEEPWEALRRSFDVIAGSGDTVPQLDTIRLLTDACLLMTKSWDKAHGWQAMLTPYLSVRLDSPDPAVDLRARVLTAAGMACLDAATEAWIACEGSVPLATLLDEAMDAVRPLASTLAEQRPYPTSCPPGSTTKKEHA